MDKIYDIAIVGGGIVGAATFYKLQQHFPNKNLVLIEKEDQLAKHQSEVILGNSFWTVLHQDLIKLGIVF